MLTYSIHQKNPADKNHYRGMGDVYFTNGSRITEIQHIFELRNFGNFILPDGTRRSYFTTDKGLLIETPFLTESVTLEWYEQSNKDCLVLGAPDPRVTNWIAAHKKQLAENRKLEEKKQLYFDKCLAIVGGEKLSPEHLELAKDVMNLDWYCDYSDDPRVRRAGEAQIQKMTERLKELGYLAILKAYSDVFIKHN